MPGEADEDRSPECRRYTRHLDVALEMVYPCLPSPDASVILRRLRPRRRLRRVPRSPAPSPLSMLPFRVQPRSRKTLDVELVERFVVAGGSLREVAMAEGVELSALRDMLEARRVG